MEQQRFSPANKSIAHFRRKSVAAMQNINQRIATTTSYSNKQKLQ